MTSKNPYRKLCLRQQTELRRLMDESGLHEQAIQLLLHQHAMLHSARMAQTEPWSFEDDLLDDLSDAQYRQIPSGCEHSVAWLLWHMARCEDITMNLLVAGTPQILLQDGWLNRLNISTRDTGNTMGVLEMAVFNQSVDPFALRAYRVAVGQRTRAVVQDLQPGDLNRKIPPASIQQIWNEGAVLEDARGIVEYWSKRTVAGLLLMPATRHNLTHLNEIADLKRKLR